MGKVGKWVWFPSECKWFGRLFSILEFLDLSMDLAVGKIDIPRNLNQFNCPPWILSPLIPWNLTGPKYKVTRKVIIWGLL